MTASGSMLLAIDKRVSRLSATLKAAFTMVILADHRNCGQPLINQQNKTVDMVALLRQYGEQIFLINHEQAPYLTSASDQQRHIIKLACH